MGCETAFFKDPPGISACALFRSGGYVYKETKHSMFPLKKAQAEKSVRSFACLFVPVIRNPDLWSFCYRKLGRLRFPQLTGKQEGSKRPISPPAHCEKGKLAVEPDEQQALTYLNRERKVF